MAAQCRRRWEGCMKLVERLERAREQGQALLAANFYNSETLLSVLRAAKRTSSAVILQTSPSTIEYLGLGQAYAMARAASAELGVETYLHLDHANDLALVRRCLDLGYDSVMIDASEEPLDANIEKTKQVIAWARAEGKTVEAELGYVPKLGQKEVTAERFTTPKRPRASLLRLESTSWRWPSEARTASTRRPRASTSRGSPRSAKWSMRRSCCTAARGSARWISNRHQKWDHQNQLRHRNQRHLYASSQAIAGRKGRDRPAQELSARHGRRHRSGCREDDDLRDRVRRTMSPLGRLLALSDQEKSRRGVVHTPREIAQQPAIWQKILADLEASRDPMREKLRAMGSGQPSAPPVVLIGAGTSDHIGRAVAPLFARNGAVMRRLSPAPICSPTTMSSCRRSVPVLPSRFRARDRARSRSQFCSCSFASTPSLATWSSPATHRGRWRSSTESETTY